MESRKYGISGEDMSHIPFVAMLVLFPLYISSKFRLPSVVIISSPTRSENLRVICDRMQA